MVEKIQKREEIFQLGKEIAELGEEAIFDVVKARNRLWLVVINELKNKRISVETARALKVDIDDMGDIVGTARMIQKIKGL